MYNENYSVRIYFIDHEFYHHSIIVKMPAVNKTVDTLTEHGMVVEHIENLYLSV